jgi:hypothetical protein
LEAQLVKVEAQGSFHISDIEHDVVKPGDLESIWHIAPSSCRTEILTAGEAGDSDWREDSDQAGCPP